VRVAVLAVAVALSLLAAPPARTDEPPLLIGTVGPGFTIEMTDATGKPLDVVTAGRYTLLVHDRADIHNFVLGKKETGERPASTEVEFVGDMTFTIDLTPGHWVYACSPHFQTMFGSFVVIPANPPDTPRKPAAPKVLTARLTATGARLSATRAKPGSYAITVVDRSKTQGFRLVGPGVRRATSAAFVGTTTWHVRLARGTYRYGGGTRLRGRLVVA
jgi:hypothetical protein